MELIAPSRGELEECVIDFESSVLLHYASLDTRIAASTTTPHRATTKPRAKLAWQRTIDFFNKYLKA